MSKKKKRQAVKKQSQATGNASCVTNEDKEVGNNGISPESLKLNGSGIQGEHKETKNEKQAPREIIQDEKQNEWISQIYFRSNTDQIQNVPLKDSQSPEGSSTNDCKGLLDSSVSRQPPNSQFPPTVKVVAYEESSRRCDVLFRMSEIFGNLWRHEDTLRDQRTNRFWLINGGLFFVLWSVFEKELDFSSFLDDLFGTPFQNSCVSFYKFNDLIDWEFVSRYILAFLISLFGVLNSIVFLFQQILGEKAFTLLYVRYKGFLAGVFSKSSIPESKELVEYIRNHNLSGVSLVPPFFGLHGNATFNAIQIPPITFTDESYIKLEEKDGFRGYDLWKTLFLVRGMCFFFAWSCITSFCVLRIILKFFYLGATPWRVALSLSSISLLLCALYVCFKEKAFLKAIKKRQKKGIKLNPFCITLKCYWESFKDYKVRNSIRILMIVVNFSWVVCSYLQFQTFCSILGAFSIFLYVYTVLLTFVFKNVAKNFDFNYFIHLFYFKPGKPTKILKITLFRLIAKARKRVR